jgi:hypothetical protein
LVETVGLDLCGLPAIEAWKRRVEAADPGNHLRMAERFRERCFLVYAVAPTSTGAAEANNALNAYIEDQRRGTVVFHDHFSRAPHGGIAVFDIGSEEQLKMVDDPGPLEGWELQVHPLTFALTAVGFIEQTHLTLREYAKTTLSALRDNEPNDPRFWWAGRD